MQEGGVLFGSAEKKIKRYIEIVCELLLGEGQYVAEGGFFFGFACSVSHLEIALLETPDVSANWLCESPLALRKRYIFSPKR